MINRMGALGVAVTLISAMIGSAIFSLSGQTISQSGGYSIFSWLIAGAIMLFYAFIASALSARFPSSGGLYLFPRLAFDRAKPYGAFLGFISAIGTTICNIIAISFSAILVPIFLSVSSDYSLFLAIVAVLVGFILNLFKLSTRGKINGAFATLIVIILLAYSILIFTSKSFDLSLFKSSFGANGVFEGLSKTLLSIPIATLGYGAIVCVCFVSGDVKSKKQLVLGIVAAAAVVILLYLLSISSTLGVVDAKEQSGLSIFFVAIERVFVASPILNYLMKTVIVLALISTIVVMFNISAVTLKAVSDEGYLPKVFSYSLKNNSPYFSLLVVALLSSLLLFKNLAFVMINLGAIFSIITIIINIASYIAIKWQERKDNLPKIISSFVLLLLLVLISISSIITSKDLRLVIIFTLFVWLLCLCAFVIRRKYTNQKIKPLFVIYGKVEHGNALGRTVGMPTANIYPSDDICKKISNMLGVYVSNVYIDGKRFNALTNIGTRPSVDESSKIVVESHILNGFDDDIYSQFIEVEIIKFIRPIIKMKDLSAVKEQVEKDKLAAQEFIDCK